MKLFFKNLVLFTFASILIGKIGAPLSAQESGISQRKHYVKVLLEQADAKKPFVWTITSPEGFILIDAENKTKTIIQLPELAISKHKNKFTCNGHLYDKTKFYLVARNGHLKWQNNEYQGVFLVTKTDTAYYLINSIDIEEYVCSVLKTESWPGWPLEVNKAFAIASRSYVFGVLLANKSQGLPYHVKNTNKHQTYTGTHTNAILKKAVEQTRGVFLTYEQKPIIAMFDTCCGGIIPAHIHGVDFTQSPYLARDYQCNYCRNAKVFSWKVEYTFEQLEKFFKKEHSQLKKITDIKVTKTDKAGLITQVQVETSNKTYTLAGKRIYSLLPHVKSYSFNLAVGKRTVHITGYGYGHHLGLCQWGAREMVRQGYDYKSVLQFYYPETKFMRLA